MELTIGHHWGRLQLTQAFGHVSSVLSGIKSISPVSACQVMR